MGLTYTSCRVWSAYLGAYPRRIKRSLSITDAVISLFGPALKLFFNVDDFTPMFFVGMMDGYRRAVGSIDRIEGVVECRIDGQSRRVVL
jgi:hypothetical protein